MALALRWERAILFARKFYQFALQREDAVRKHIEQFSQTGEDQTVFGYRFAVHRRTIIRWEKGGHFFPSWGSYRRPDGKSEQDLMQATIALADARTAKVAKRKTRTRKKPKPRLKAKRRAKRVKRVKKAGRRK